MTTNVNILSDDEWRAIHNALSVYQCSFVVDQLQETAYVITKRKEIQQLMDKVRDNYIAPQ